jgi:hypothetical protein
MVKEDKIMYKKGYLLVIISFILFCAATVIPGQCNIPQMIAKSRTMASQDKIDFGYPIDPYWLDYWD